MGHLLTMLSIGPLKPVLTALLLPPGGLLVLIFLGCLLARTYRRLAWGIVMLASATMWILACDATASGLSRLLLKSYAPISAQDLNKAQAIVVLGGGVDKFAPEFGSEELSSTAYKRLAYAAHLTKQTHLPVLFAGGKGWAASGNQYGSEAEIAEHTMARDFGLQLKWLDKTSRDTRENASSAYEVLSPLGIKRIALVTNDWHMQRSLRNFEQAGFEVHPAPMGYLQPPLNTPTDFVPTLSGLSQSYLVLREWLGLLLT